MSGIGLNLFDVADTVDHLMAKQYIRYFQLQTAKSAEQIQLTAYGSLQSLFTTFQQKTKNLGSVFNTIAYQASTSDANVVASATVTSNTVGSGSHSITVSQLAQAQRQISQAVFTTRTASLGISETLTFTNPGAQNFSVQIDSGDSLETVRDKINNSSQNIGISAAIVSSTGAGGTTQYNLVLNSGEGTANQITISGDTGSQFNFTETVAAMDALFTFDGFNVTRSSNVVSDVMDGMTFNLSGLGSAVINTSSNGVDVPGKIKSAVTDMLAAYNQIITFLDGNQIVTSRDDNSKQSTSVNNTAFNFIKTRLQAAMNLPAGNSTSIRDLRQAGIVVSPETKVTDQYDPSRTVSSVGSLMIDLQEQVQYNNSTTMDWVLKNDINSLNDFFNNAQNGLVANVNSVINTSILAQDDSGIINNATKTIQSQSEYTDNQITNEKNRLDMVKSGLIDRFSRLNGIISYYQNLSQALEKQYDYLNGMLRSGK